MTVSLLQTVRTLVLFCVEPLKRDHGNRAPVRSAAKTEFRSSFFGVITEIGAADFTIPMLSTACFRRCLTVKSPILCKRARSRNNSNFPFRYRELRISNTFAVRRRAPSRSTTATPIFETESADTNQREILGQLHERSRVNIIVFPTPKVVSGEALGERS